ncbi:MAG TPA: site-specific integrase, partial [Bacillales bacterium]|nr:site-specific integrase [Bacillales bacterium]
KRILTVLKRFYGHFRELGIVAANPAANVVLNEEPTNNSLSTNDFISDKESTRLFRSVFSSVGLSENQQRCRIYLTERNLAILTLFLHYGPTLTELVSIRMRDVYFERNNIVISSVSSLSRTIELRETDMKLLFSYYRKIPQAVRPHRHSNDPLFVAFDFQRNTYRWDYSNDTPKALTEIAVQKMIRQEIQRAGLREGISAQHLRRTCILKMLERGEPNEKVQTMAGLKSKLSLKTYIHFLQQKSPGHPGE